MTAKKDDDEKNTNAQTRINVKRTFIKEIKTEEINENGGRK